MERLVECVEQLAEAVAILETRQGGETSFVQVNGAFTRLFGYTAAELAGRPGTRIWGPRTDLDRMAWIRSRMARGKEVRAVVVLYTRDGSLVWTEVGAAPLAHEADGMLFHIVTYRDVTSRKQFEDALSSEKRKLQTTLASIADAVVTVLGDGRVEFVNAAAQRLLGIALIDAYGAQAGDVIQLVDDAGAPLDVLAGTGAGGAARRGEGHLHAPTGTVDIAYVASRIDDEDQGFVVVLRDVTAENRLSLKLSFEANHDPLTSLPNRRAFLERLGQAARSAREDGRRHVVAFLDLDRFKVVNDRFGHAAGDRLLREVAAVMGKVVRAGDVIGRIGGDEFALLLSDCTIENARSVVDKLRQAVDAYRIEHTGESLGVGVSIGLAAIDRGSAGATQALAEADAACYQAKAAGRNVIAG
jgi:diguanylate cyclase (GGDEF)-like protein/PAS domain S-box-containing protein